MKGVDYLELGSRGSRGDPVPVLMQRVTGKRALGRRLSPAVLSASFSTVEILLLCLGLCVEVGSENHLNLRKTRFCSTQKI